jgi:two-component system sensor histidine kinase CiaH
VFHSATLKLTLWYLLILSSVGLMFSAVIYQVASSEIDSRLENVQQRLQNEAEARNILFPDYDFAALRALQARQAETSMFTSLIYMNVLFLAVGGVASYVMARRTLGPIEQAHEDQSRFTSDASHELRTPLAAMKTELEVALRDPKLSKQEMRELLESNLEEVNKLSKITQTLLLLSRLEHGSLTTGRVAFDDIVRRVVENLNKKKSRIIYTPPDRSLYIIAHQVSIEELATILIDNALKHSPAHSKVHVRLTRSGKKAQLRIINSGKGILPEELPYIFERFYRTDDSRTRGEQTGFGLGLSLAKKIVEVHQGDLSASSQPGKKTTFTASIPLYEAPGKRKKRLPKSQQS